MHSGRGGTPGRYFGWEGGEEDEASKEQKRLAETKKGSEERAKGTAPPPTKHWFSARNPHRSASHTVDRYGYQIEPAQPVPSAPSPSSSPMGGVGWGGSWPWGGGLESPAASPPEGQAGASTQLSTTGEAALHELASQTTEAAERGRGESPPNPAAAFARLSQPRPKPAAAVVAPPRKAPARATRETAQRLGMTGPMRTSSPTIQAELIKRGLHERIKSDHPRAEAAAVTLQAARRRAAASKLVQTTRARQLDMKDPTKVAAATTIQRRERGKQARARVKRMKPKKKPRPKPKAPVRGRRSSSEGSAAAASPPASAATGAGSPEAEAATEGTDVTAGDDHALAV